jgi:hypothetical protein
MDHLKAKEPQRKLGFQKIDEDQSGQNRCGGRYDQGALPVLGKDRFEEKRDENKGDEGKSEGFEEKQIGNHGEKGHEYPLPGIGKRKEGRHDLPFLPLETPQEKKNGHYGKDNAGPERHETRTRLTPGANFHCPSVEREKHPDTDEKQGRYAVVMIYFLFHIPPISRCRIATGILLILTGQSVLQDHTPEASPALRASETQTKPG